MRRRSNTLTCDNDYPAMSQSDKFCACSTHGDTIAAYSPTGLSSMLSLIENSNDSSGHSFQSSECLWASYVILAQTYLSALNRDHSIMNVCSELRSPQGHPKLYFDLKMQANKHFGHLSVSFFKWPKISGGCDSPFLLHLISSTFLHFGYFFSCA